MGETGCGKTRLIRFMCNLMAQKCVQKNLLILKASTDILGCHSFPPFDPISNLIPHVYWLFSTCTFNNSQQGNMYLTGIAFFHDHCQGVLLGEHDS